MSASAERVTSIRKSMAALEVLERLLSGPSPTFVDISEPFPERLARLEPLYLFEEPAVRSRILNDELGLAVYGEHQRCT